MPIVMLSNDVDNRRKAAEAGVTAMSVQVRLMQSWCVACCQGMVFDQAAGAAAGTSSLLPLGRACCLC